MTAHAEPQVERPAPDRVVAREAERSPEPMAEPGNQAMQRAWVGGAPLDGGLRNAAEARLGLGLGHVRLHGGAAADRAARGLKARAFLAGNNIVLGGGATRNSLAHELIHVAQRSRNGAGSADGGAAAEREAARLAPALLGGAPVRPTAALGPGIHREDLTCEPEEPSFRAADVDVGGMTNEFLNTEAVRVDDWLRGNPLDTEPDLPEYRELGRRLRAERQLRVGAGHLWMAEAGREMPTALYQLVGGGDRISVETADLAAAFGLPEGSHGNPIMTPGQFQQYLTAHGIVSVAPDSPQALAAMGAGPGEDPYGVCDPLAPEAPAPGDPAAATEQDDPLRAPLARGPMLATPLPPGRPYPFGVAAEGPITATYYPGGVTLPRAYPGFDAVRGGDWDSSIGFQGRGKARIEIVTQTIVGGEWIGIKSLTGPAQATPDHIDSVVRAALSDMVNKKNTPPRDPTPVDGDTYWKVAPADPDSVVVHILIPEEAVRNLPELQAAASRRAADHGYGASLPAKVDARVTAWEGRPRGSPEATPGPIQPAGTPGGRIGVGAAASGVIAITVGGVQMLVDARDHPEWAAELAAQGGRGVISGGAQQIMEEAVVRSGGRVLTGATGVALRTLGRRVGSGVTASALEVYDMYNEPYDHSTAEQVVRPARAAAIGVASTELGFYAGAAAVAPATAGALFILSAAGYGAAAGSVAPVVGTAVGFIVGLAIGVGAYMLMDAATPGGRDDWDHKGPQPGAAGPAADPAADAAQAQERVREAEARLHSEGTPFAAGIDDNAMPQGFGLRQDERDTCVP